MSKDVFELKLTDAVVLIRELTVEEYIRAHRSADSGEKSLLVQSSQIARASVAMAVVNVNGTPVTYADLQGPGWKKHLPRRRSYVQLSDYFGDLHSPTDDDAEKVKASVEATYDDETDVEIWTFTLPGRFGSEDRVVKMQEIDPGSVDDALRSAEKQSKRDQSGMLQVLEAVSRCLVEVDGNAFASGGGVKSISSLFSVWEARLLAVVYIELNGAGAELAPLGKPKPAGGGE